MMLEVVTYAGLVSAMPRAGGDYIWQSRVFHSTVGFVVAITAWWLIIFQWTPIYASISLDLFIKPVVRVLGANGVANWLGTPTGIFISSLVVIVVVTYLCGMGMKRYAVYQKWAMWIGLGGLAVAGIILLVTSKSGFIAAFDRGAVKYYGPGAANAYAKIVKSYGAGQPHSPFAGSFWQTLKMVPFMLFWLIWPLWGATLYGEIRGAKNFRSNIYQMGGALIAEAAMGLAFLLLVSKTMGYHFFMSTGNANYDPSSILKGDWVSPVAMVAWVVNNAAFQVILLLAVFMFLFAFWGTLYLSSTRAIFAAAFDRILPEKAAAVSRSGVPWVALLLMAVPSVLASGLYAYSSWFARLTLDSTLVFAVMFLVSALALMIMPWRTKGIWASSPLPKVKIAGIPVMSIIAAGYSAVLIFTLVMWLKDAVYGVNNGKSLIYLGCLYLAALVMWLVAWVTRRRQGMDLETVAKEIPVE
jgi:amino acid transporter